MIESGGQSTGNLDHHLDARHVLDSVFRQRFRIYVELLGCEDQPHGIGFYFHRGEQKTQRAVLPSQFFLPLHQKKLNFHSLIAQKAHYFTSLLLNFSTVALGG